MTKIRKDSDIVDTEFSEVKTEDKNSTTVNADDLKQKEKSKIRVDFINDEGGSEDFIKRPTKEKDGSSSDSEDKKDRSTDELNEERKRAEERKFSEKDFKLFSDFIVNALDAGIATFCKYWSDDTSDAAYSINQSKKDLLSEQLTLILAKYFKFLRIELIFLFSLVICFSGPVVKAKKLRKAKQTSKRKNEQYKEKKKQDQENNKGQEEKIKDAEVITEFDKDGNEIVKGNDEGDFIPPAKTIRRRPGGPDKG